MDELFALSFSQRYKDIEGTFTLAEREEGLTVRCEARSTWSLEEWPGDWLLKPWQAEMVQRMMGRYLEKQRA